MSKFKIFITCFILYEFIVLAILQVPNFCVYVFNNNFCAIGAFKYWLFVVMLPVLFGLIYWWLPKTTQNTDLEIKKDKNFQEVLIDMIPKQYIQRFLIAAVIVLARKFIMSYPRAKNFFNNVKDILKKQKVNFGKKS